MCKPERVRERGREGDEERERERERHKDMQRAKPVGRSCTAYARCYTQEPTTSRTGAHGVKELGLVTLH